MSFSRKNFLSKENFSFPICMPNFCVSMSQSINQDSQVSHTFSYSRICPRAVKYMKEHFSKIFKVDENLTWC